MRLIKYRHNLVAFHSVQTENSEGVRNTDIGEPREAVYGYFTFQVLHAGEMILVTSGMEGKERKIRILREFMRMDLDDLESSGTAGCDARLSSNVYVDCFRILPFCCCELSV